MGQPLVDNFPDSSATVKIVDLNQVGFGSSELFVAHSIDLELASGNIFGLRPLLLFEVHNADLIGISAANQIDPAVDHDAISQFQLNSLFDMLQPIQVLPMLPQVASQ